MFPVPVTFVFSFKSVPDTLRPYILHEFAVNGAKHLVLTNFLIQEMMADWQNAVRMQREMAAEGLSFRDAHAPFGGVLDMNCPDPDFRPPRSQLFLNPRSQLFLNSGCQLFLNSQVNYS